MQIENHRRFKQQLVFAILLCSGFAALIIIGNAISNNPDHSFGFYAIATVCALMPVIMGIPYYMITAKTIVIEENGVAEYKKDILIKRVNFNEITSLRLTNTLLYIWTVGDFIKFANNKKGFAEHELPFLVEISRRCGFRVFAEGLGYAINDKRIFMINDAIKKAQEKSLQK